LGCVGHGLFWSLAGLGMGYVDHKMGWLLTGLIIGWLATGRTRSGLDMGLPGYAVGWPWAAHVLDCPLAGLAMG
jgi:hypothetical protein